MLEPGEGSNRKCATGLGGYREGMAATCFHFIAIPCWFPADCRWLR